MLLYQNSMIFVRKPHIPTSRSPSLVKATTEGVVLEPSAFSMTRGFLPSITLTQEFVVPKSIPTTWPLAELMF